MRRKKLWLSVATLSLLTAQMLTACERAVPDRGIYQPEPEEEPTQKPTPTQEPEPETPTPTAAASGAGLALDASEIEYINEYICVDYNGFFLCDYCCPEMIDWGCVLYNGAGIDRDLTDEEYDDYTSEYGEVMTGITAIDEDAINDYIKQTTYSDIAHSIKGIDWPYLYKYRVYCSAHGDTNYMPIKVTGGEKNGDIYTIEYNKQDSLISASRDYVLTAEVSAGGDWKFISNLPKNDPTQAVLLNIEFYPEEEDLYASDPVDLYEVEMLESDEPGTSWCLITAKEDNTYITLNRADISNEYKESLIWSGIFLPGEELYSVCLNAGESIGINTNLPWNPRIHMSVNANGFEGEYWFGQDNWRHNYNDFGMQDSVLVVGHNARAEGRGIQPQNILQFLNMFKGNWIMFDKYGDAHYTFEFDDELPDTLRIQSRYDYYEMSLNAGYMDQSSGSIPDSIAVTITGDIPKDKLGDYDCDSAAFYKVEADDNGSMIILTLTAADEDPDRDIFKYLLHNCGDDGVYKLYRYK